MKTSLCLTPTVESVYTLWWILQNTADEVTAFYFHLPSPKDTQRQYAVLPSQEEYDDIHLIASLMATQFRHFDFIVKDITNYIPRWGTIPSFELINCSKESDQIVFSDTVEDVDPNSIHRRTGNARVYLRVFHNMNGPGVAYPLMEAGKGRANAHGRVPDDVLDIIAKYDPAVTTRRKLLGNGVFPSSIVAKEKSFRDRSHPRSGIEQDGRWFVDGDPDFGVVMGPTPILATHPYYKYITVPLTDD